MKENLSVLLVVLLLATLCLAFDIRTIKAMGTIYIQADGSIDPPEAAISSLDNVTYTLTGDVYDSIVIERSNIVIDGAYHIVQGDGTGNGFTMQDVANVTIRNTEIRDCFEGIQFFNSSNNLVTGNTVVENSYEGIVLYFSSDTEITGNMIANNQIGIAFYNSSSNLVVHNNIVNNAYQAYVEFSLNSWDEDYPSGGNYWSDYSGVDTKWGPNQDHPGADGIGDTPYTIDSNNIDRYPLMTPWIPPEHDVSIINASPLKTVVGLGYSVNASVTAINQGKHAEAFNVTAYANTTIIASQNVTLSAGDSVTVTFTWGTTGFALGNYTINAYAWPVPAENNTANNNCTWSVPVHVGVPGDVSSTVPGAYDGKVDMKDVAYLVSLFNTKPSSPNWQPNADINNDGVCNMKDIAIAVAYFNKHE